MSAPTSAAPTLLQPFQLLYWHQPFCINHSDWKLDTWSWKLPSSRQRARHCACTTSHSVWLTYGSNVWHIVFSFWCRYFWGGVTVKLHEVLITDRLHNSEQPLLGQQELGSGWGLGKRAPPCTISTWHIQDEMAQGTTPVHAQIHASIPPQQTQRDPEPWISKDFYKNHEFE